MEKTEPIGPTEAVDLNREFTYPHNDFPVLWFPDQDAYITSFSKVEVFKLIHSRKFDTDIGPTVCRYYLQSLMHF